MYNYLVHKENNLFSSILQEFTRMDNIKLDYYFIPMEIPNKKN